MHKPYSEDGRPLEIERRYLIRRPEPDALRTMPGCRVLELEQVYLLSCTGERSRIRRTEEDGVLSYFHTVKRDVTRVTRIEVEKQITAEDYQRLLPSADPARQPIRKTRFCLPYQGKVLEIDLYPWWNDQAILEVELASEEEAVCFPPEIEILREVTDDLAYRNSSLALKARELI